jgi:hypothetical protein
MLKKVNPTKSLRVTVMGEATWPYAWYVAAFPGFDFVKPTAEKANDYDVIIIDQTELEAAKTELPKFQNLQLAPACLVDSNSKSNSQGHLQILFHRRKLRET